MSLNPRPIQNDHLKENWKTFRNRGLHFIHLNINSLLPKIADLREILTNPNKKITRCELINIGLSDHEMIFFTRKVKKEKVGGQKQI